MEFILRKLSKDGEKVIEDGNKVDIYKTVNIGLGGNYGLVKKQEGSIEFEKIIDEFKGFAGDDDIYAFVVGEDSIPIPLYKTQFNYIMTGNGSTFEYVPF